jgi:hypothetical protein
MNNKNQTRLSGVIGMASSGLWLIALIIEYQYGLRPPGNASLIYFGDQIMFFIALVGYFLMLLGLWKSKAAGDGIFDRISKLNWMKPGLTGWHLYAENIEKKKELKL